MIIGSKVFRTSSTDDSMAWAKEHISDAPDGSVFLADKLTKARGRQGRAWELYPGQLGVTFILKPPQLATIGKEDLSIRLNQLNMAVTLGILDGLKSYGVGLKWPNDFVVQGKKLCGMLIQLVWHTDRPLGIIIGFSINVNNEFEATDPLYSIATSLKTLTGTNQNVRSLYYKINESMNAWYLCWKQQKFMQIYKAWKDEQVCLGEHLRIHQKDGSLAEGVMQQVLPNGDIVLLDQHDKQKIIPFYQVEDVIVGKQG